MLGVPIVQNGRFEQTYLGLLPIWLEHPRGVISINFHHSLLEAFDGNSNLIEHTLAFHVFIWYLECFNVPYIHNNAKGLGVGVVQSHESFLDIFLHSTCERI